MDWISRQEDNGKTDGLFGKTDWQWERLRTSGKTDGDTGLVTATNKVNDSPMIVREGGVEEQSSTERITWNLDTVKILGQQQRTPHNQILQPPDGLFGKTDWQWERLRTSEKNDGDTGLVTATNKVNESPMIVREGGVEEQSSTERIT